MLFLLRSEAVLQVQTKGDRTGSGSCRVRTQRFEDEASSTSQGAWDGGATSHAY